MSEKQWIFVVFSIYVVWMIFGIVFIFRRKLKIINRIGRPVTNDELIALAKAGDKEIGDVFRDTKVFVAIGQVAGVSVYFIKP